MKINLSYIPNLHPESPKSAVAKIAANGMMRGTFEFNELTLTDFVKTHAMSSWYFDGRKILENVVQESANTFILDFDNEHPTIDEAVEFFESLNINYFLFSSVSHQKDKKGITCDRFKVIIPIDNFLDKRIMDKYAEWWNKALQNYNPLFKVDQASFVPSQYQHPTPAEVAYFQGNKETLDLSSIIYIPKLKKSSAEQELKENLKQARLTTPSSENTSHAKTLDLDDEILLEDKKTTTLVRNVRDHIICYCPFCDDVNSESASAFLDINTQGRIFLACSHCKSEGNQSTFWLEEDFVPEHIPLKVFFEDNTGALIRILEDYDEYTEELDMEEPQQRIKRFEGQDDWTNWAAKYFKITGKQARELKPDLMRFTTTYRPDKPSGIILTKNPYKSNYYNLFRPSELMKKYEKYPKNSRPIDLEYLNEVCPTIMRIYRNLFDTDENINYFNNQLAYILQLRQKPNTGFMITAQPGSGKDTIFHEIIEVIFRKENCDLREGKHMGEEFNSLDMGRWIIGFNEVEVGGNYDRSTRISNLKSAITDQVIRIRLMFHNPYQIKNFLSYLIFSNKNMPLRLDANDRRFYVINTNDTSVNLLRTEKNPDGLYDTYEEIKKGIQNDIEKYTEYLFTVQVREDWAANAPLTLAKEDLTQQAMSPAENLALLVREGRIDDLDSWDNIVFTEDRPKFDKDTNMWSPEKTAGKEFCRDYVKEYRVLPSRFKDDLIKVLYPNKFNFGENEFKECFKYVRTSKIRKYVPQKG
jgi:hypothetical protein